MIFPVIQFITYAAGDNQYFYAGGHGKRNNKTAKEEHRTISELLREAYREYKFRKDWERIRRIGEETSRRMGITSIDDIERIAG